MNADSSENTEHSESRASDLDWLIVGGGIHGVHIAARLIGEAGVRPAALAIVDPAAELLARWRRCTSTTGMTHLRSPAVHHLGQNPSSLLTFAGRRKRWPKSTFRAPYNRPSLDLFNAHCDHVVDTYGLAARHWQAEVTELSLSADGATVRLRRSAASPSDGVTETVSARRVVLALGAGGKPSWPRVLPPDDARIQHIFDPSFDPSVFEPADGSAAGKPSLRIAVVGGGISAAQVALRAHHAGHEVDIVSPHALRSHQFDSEPGWLGPKFMRGFEVETDLGRRREMISSARHRGSVPPDVERSLSQASATGRLRWRVLGIEKVLTESPIELLLQNGDRLGVDRVLVATGFDGARPGGALIDDVVDKHALPCAECGYPVVDRTLAWHPALYTTGPLAELEIGPVARNISGAIRAANRLVDVARSVA